jgi:AraC family transcriptional regulator of adaptative response/methylated-DNA-[protein]-cysteine methyltransferase
MPGLTATQRVREELSRRATVTEAIYGAGFNSNGRFYATSSEVLGMSPSEFRAGAPDAEIKFAIGKSSLGLVLVAASDKGVCAIFFGDSPDELERDLKKQFPRAKLIGNDNAFGQLVAKVIHFVEDPRTGFDLPWTSAVPRFSIACGRRSAASLPARRLATRRLPRPSAHRKRCAPWRGPAPRTASPWQFRVIA